MGGQVTDAAVLAYTVVLARGRLGDGLTLLESMLHPVGDVDRFPGSAGRQHGGDEEQIQKPAEQPNGARCHHESIARSIHKRSLAQQCVSTRRLTLQALQVLQSSPYGPKAHCAVGVAICALAPGLLAAAD